MIYSRCASKEQKIVNRNSVPPVQSGTRPSPMRAVTLRILDAVAVVITASAVIVLFIALPYAALDRWQLLPHWDIFGLFFLFFPFIVAWDRVGIYLLLTVIGCEATVVVLRPAVRRTKLSPAASVAVCVLTYLWVYVAHRFNIH